MAEAEFLDRTRTWIPPRPCASRVGREAMSGRDAGPKSPAKSGGRGGGLLSRLLGRRARKSDAKGGTGTSGWGEDGGNFLPRSRRLRGETWRVKVSYDTQTAGPPDLEYRVERGPVKGGLVLSVQGHARHWRDSEVRLECVVGHAAARPRAEELQLNVDAKVGSLLKRLRYEQELVRVARGAPGFEGWRLKLRNVVRTTTALEGLGDLALDYTLPEEGLRVLPVVALAAAEAAMPEPAVRAFYEYKARTKGGTGAATGAANGAADGAAANGVGAKRSVPPPSDMGQLRGSLTAPVLDETLATVQVGYDFQTKTITDVTARKDMGVLGKGSVEWDMAKPADSRMTLRTHLVPRPNSGLRSSLRLGASWAQDTDTATFDATLAGFLRADRTLLSRFGRVDFVLKAATMRGPVRDTWKRYREEWAMVGPDARAAWLRGDLTPRLVLSKTFKL